VQTLIECLLFKSQEHMEPLLNIAINAARQAGDLIIRHREQIEHLQISTKQGQECVSEVDLKAEQAIINTIHKAHPTHAILAEENGLLQGDSEVVWIVDPLDGTSNYLHGFPFFSVSIAVKVKSRIEHAVVLDPLNKECFIASRGQGARVNERRIRVSKQTKLSESLLATGVPLRDVVLAERYLPTLKALIGNCLGMRRTGSAALDLVYVASARLDGLWKLGLRPWDVAAGALILREAGGMISDPQGGENFLQSGDVIAGTPKVFKSLLQLLSPILGRKA
jgi:myo-inositol-1(or 4)-monophosphatase